MRWTDPATGWTFYGAIDDLWQKPDGTLIVADYKATAKADEITPENIYPGYKRQLEMYQFLIERAGFSVDARSWLVYANGIKDAGAFGDVLRFRTRMVAIDCDGRWVEWAFREAVAVLVSGERPGAKEGCGWCRYAVKKAEK